MNLHAFNPPSADIITHLNERSSSVDMKPLLKYFAALVVGASHSFFPLLVMTSAFSVQGLSTPSSTLTSSNLQEYKIGSLPLVLASWERVNKMKDKMEIDKKSGADSKDIYDFIVAGAGTGGSIVAAKLAEHFSVLLLEAGGQPHTSHENPAMTMIMAKQQETDWMYSSVAQNDSCYLCPDRKYIFSAGKGLGGSANLNYLDGLYEGAFQDYSEWMEKTQDPGWGYYMLQPYFKTVKAYMTKKYQISQGESLYYRSTFKALVRPTANLYVHKYSHVNKVIFDESDDQLRAHGVEYERHGILKQAFASKEVIISSGTFGTPKILMLSGIGPKSVLNSSEIAVKVELPVGSNFQDHLAIPLGPFFKTTDKELVVEKSEIKEKFQNAWNSSSILRMPLINLKYDLYEREMSHFFGMNETTLKMYMKASQRSKKSVVSREDTIFINVAIKKPISRGEVKIAGKDPKLPPIISPNYLNAIHHQDTLAYSSEKQKLIEALEETVRLMEGNPNMKLKFTDFSFPGCERYIFRGYGYWDCYIKHFSMSFNHGVGTCAMGAVTTPASAVVDPELKVRGTKALRVIDASVCPTLFGYPFLTVAVVAEKGVDMIIKEHKFSGKTETASSKLDLNEDDRTRHDHQPFLGFRIKELTTSSPLKTSKSVPFAMSKSWQKADQLFIPAYSHHVDSSLSEIDLIPPGETSTTRPNPSYFPVKPLAGRLIFHPLIPQADENIFKLKEANRADVEVL